MQKDEQPTVIKKYANRRLYDTGSSTYVTLEDLAVMVRDGGDFIVQDAKTGEDLTRSVLTQIIFEQEAKGQNLLPISFLRQLITFYGDSMQNLVPSYLDYSMSSLLRDQEKLREQVTGVFNTGTLGTSAMQAIEEQTNRNMEMFQQTMQMFMPFDAGESGATKTEPTAAEPSNEKSNPSQLELLQQQMAQMQQQLSELSKKK